MPTRRTFLHQGAGLALSFCLSPKSQAAALEPNAYLHIASDDTVTLWITRSEMGQGVRTSLATVLCEELDFDPDKAVLQQAIPGVRFQGIRLRTSGSGSSSATFLALRRAGAAAREMLITAAAQTWSVDRAACRAELGRVIHTPSQRALRYGELVDLAATLDVPKEPPLKSPAAFRWIGKPRKRVDTPAIVNGKAVFGLDVRVPGMLVAVVARCPYLDGKVRSFDAKKTLAAPGVRYAVPISRGIFPGVAVVATDTWSAMKGRDLLTVDWERGAAHDFDSGTFMESLKRAAAQEGYPVRRVGAAAGPSAKTLDAVYEFPFQAHAPLEPMNCVADVRAGSCEVWAPSQTPETAQEHIVQALGLPLEAVTVHTTLLGGGFGRRLFVDYVDEAVELSKAIHHPVQIVWTREDDMRNGFFQPASIERFEATLEGKGIRSWTHKSVGSPLSMFGRPTPEEMKDRDRFAKDESPWGAYDTPYNFPSMKIDYVPVDSPVPTGAWRAVDYPSRVFGRECFLDEVAHALTVDPLQLRIDLLYPGDVIALGSQRLDRSRLIHVLETIRDKSGWTKPLTIPNTAGRLTGRGLAINVYDSGSYQAQVAEVSVARDFRSLRVHRIVCVVDCGLVINPSGIAGQVESGITWGLSATLHGKIDFKNGRTVQSNYHDFRVAALTEMPRIEAHIIPSTARPAGFGEHTVPPVAPAIANAVFAATGRRIRRLPLDLTAAQ